MAKKRIYYHEFRRALDNSPLKPVYLFTGAEVFLKEEGVQVLLDKALSPEERSLNLESLYAGSDVSGRDLVERAQTLPFMGEKRVIIVRQAEKWKAQDLAALLGYLQDPAPTTLLILSSQEERLTQASWRQVAR